MPEGRASVVDRRGREARVAYARTGRRPAVVLIHGVGLDGSVWRPQAEALAADHDVVAVDMPGHGGSDPPAVDARLADYAAAVLAALDDAGIGRAHVVGHSMGALVALELALAHPSRVASVVAMNAVFCRSPEQRAAIDARVAALDRSDAVPDWTGTIARWFGDPVPPALAPAAAHTRALLERIDPAGYAHTYRLFAGSDAAHRERLVGLSVPALFLTGEHDPNSTPAMSEAMARLAPDARLEVMPGERHMMALTDPDGVTARLRRFFGEVEARRPAAPNDAAEAIDPRALRKALGSFLTGVTVVATIQADGTPRGFTANSFTSVSLDPPLVLVCIGKTASSYAAFRAADHFSVNVLAEHQADLSSLFASKSADKFARAAWRPGPLGSPLLDDVAAWFDCRRHDLIDAGDHVILVGRVAGFAERPANPLGYCRGAHVTFGLQLDALASSGGRTRIAAILEHEGTVVLVEDGRGGLELPSGAALGGATEAGSLAGCLARLGLDAEIGFLFAVFDDPGRGPGAMSIVYRGELRRPPDRRDARVVLAPADALPLGRIRDEAVRTMLARYAEERRRDLFGIYVGDAGHGTVQALAPRTGGEGR